jgi:hypothetical protein
MRKLICTLIIMLIFSVMLFVDGSHVSPPLGCSITSDTAWTKANSPHIPTSIVALSSEVKIAILQGTTNELTLTSTPAPTATPTPTPLPTPSPTPKIMPGSPLSLGDSTFAETLSQFDLMGIAKLVLIALGIMWVIIILSYVDRKFAKKETKNP